MTTWKSNEDASWLEIIVRTAKTLCHRRSPSTVTLLHKTCQSSPHRNMRWKAFWCAYPRSSCVLQLSTSGSRVILSLSSLDQLPTWLEPTGLVFKTMYGKNIQHHNLLSASLRCLVHMGCFSRRSWRSSLFLPAVAGGGAQHPLLQQTMYSVSGKGSL